MLTRRMLVICALPLGLCGCNMFKALVYYLSPPQTKDAEFTFPKDAVIALMIDPARAEMESPVFNRALHERLVEIFREKKSDAQLIAPRDVLALRRKNPEFEHWSVRRIGQELEATHVLYARLDQLSVREPRDSPVLEPRVALRLKVIGVSLPDNDARVWPTEKEGRLITASRQASEAVDPGRDDAELVRLGREAAYLVAQPFFEVNLEEKTPRED
jgi:hypothetical protein